MGMSIRAYARRRGISDAAVRKAIKTGRVTPLADGTINPERADLEWELATDKSQQRKPQPNVNAALEGIRETLREGGQPAGGSNFLHARTANEILKAQTARLKLQRMRGEVIDKAEVTAMVFRLAREERDAWVNWPARISALMAAELGIEPHQMHMCLEKHVRQHLAELADIKFPPGGPAGGPTGGSSGVA